jgi:two-component system cell cycle response regulator
MIRLLMIKDDIDDAYQQKRFLLSSEVEKFQINTCTTIKEALTALRSNEFDIVLTDLNLPDSSGLNTLSEILAYAGETPVIALTGFDDDAVGIAAEKAGAADYIPKSQLNEQFFLRTEKFCIERHLLLHKIQSQANIDELTQLPNRYALMTRLKVLIDQSQRNEATLALVYIGLDGFKLINDENGHQSGDEVLQEIASRIRLNLRKADFAARIGGDEFILIITNYKSSSNLYRLIERKMDILNKPIYFNSTDLVKQVTVGASYGVSEFKVGMSIDHLIDEADSKMYINKRNHSISTQTNLAAASHSH